MIGKGITKLIGYAIAGAIALVAGTQILVSVVFPTILVQEEYYIHDTGPLKQLSQYDECMVLSIVVHNSYKSL